MPSPTGADDCVLARRLRLLDILDDVRRVRPADPPATSAPGLGSPLATPASGLGLHAHPDDICTGTRLTPSTSAPGLGSLAASFAPGAAAALIARDRPRASLRQTRASPRSLASPQHPNGTGRAGRPLPAPPLDCGLLLWQGHARGRLGPIGPRRAPARPPIPCTRPARRGERRGDDAAGARVAASGLGGRDPAAVPPVASNGGTLRVGAGRAG